VAQSKSHDGSLDSSDRRRHGYSFEGGRRQTGGEISKKEKSRASIGGELGWQPVTLRNIDYFEPNSLNKRSPTLFQFLNYSN